MTTYGSDADRVRARAPRPTEKGKSLPFSTPFPPLSFTSFTASRSHRCCRDIACIVSSLSDGRHHRNGRHRRRRSNGHRPHHHTSARHRHWVHSHGHHLRIRHHTRRANRRQGIHRSSGGSIRHPWIRRSTALSRLVASYQAADETSIHVRNRPTLNHRKENRSHAIPSNQNQAWCGSNNSRYCPLGRRRQTRRETLRYWRAA